MTRDELIAAIMDGSFLNSPGGIDEFLSEAGYTLAPLEPTEKMIHAGKREMPNPSCLITAYRAMLAAQEAE